MNQRKEGRKEGKKETCMYIRSCEIEEYEFVHKIGNENFTINI